MKNQSSKSGWHEPNTVLPKNVFFHHSSHAPFAWKFHRDRTIAVILYSPIGMMQNFMGDTLYTVNLADILSPNESPSSILHRRHHSYFFSLLHSFPSVLSSVSPPPNV